MLKEYLCHKKVKAFKIAQIEPSIKGYLLYDESGLKAIEVGFDWMIKHEAKEDGYCVAYEDGYTSYSPAEAFEAGYKLIEQDQFLKNLDATESLNKVNNEFAKIFVVDGNQVLVTKDNINGDEGCEPGIKIRFSVNGHTIHEELLYESSNVRDEVFNIISQQDAEFLVSSGIKQLEGFINAN